VYDCWLVNKAAEVYLPECLQQQDNVPETNRMVDLALEEGKKC
jgi:hypothetical protein